MAEKEDKMILEREYIVPLSRDFLKVPEFRRTPKAIKALVKFVARHMQVRDDDRKIKIDTYLNEELWMHSIRKPPRKVKIKCTKYESGIVKVELAEVPEYVKIRKDKAERSKNKVVKKEKEVVEKKEISTEEKEKEQSTVEAGLKVAEEQHKEIKHEVSDPKIKKQTMPRKTLQK